MDGIFGQDTPLAGNHSGIGKARGLTNVVPSGIMSVSDISDDDTYE